MNTTESIFLEIVASELFRIDGPAIDLPEVLLELAAAIKSEEETNWELGECGACCLSDFLAGAYWSLTEWHAGQWSPEYAALCALGGIFRPGCTSAPESAEESEWAAYEACNEWFQSRQPVEGILPASIDGRPVKNLGWLLRNWRKVRSFAIRPHPPLKGGGFRPDAVLYAYTSAGTYRTGFSSATILADWLDRPIFRGLPQYWHLAK
jgi:hypothetical protein